jgi:hypothetical protein
MNPKLLRTNNVPEGALVEYLAYREGLPVTKRLVDSYMQLVGSLEDVEAVSLGNVVFDCENAPYDTQLDLSTLSRMFGLVDDLVKDGMLREKDEKGNFVIPLPYMDHYARLALSGLYWSPNGTSYRVPYACLQFLRPRDTAYYFRYAWAVGEDGCILTWERKLTKQETLNFVEEVSLGLDEETRAEHGDYNRLTGSTKLGPVISYLTLRTSRSLDLPELFRLLLPGQPSLHLYLSCLVGVLLVPTGINALQLDDNGSNLNQKDWHRIQKYLYKVLRVVTDWEAYRRVMVILGWGIFFPKVEGFICPVLTPYRRVKDPKHPLEVKPWMDETMKSYVIRVHCEDLSQEGELIDLDTIDTT